MIHRRYHIRDGAKTAAGGTVRASIAWYKIDGIPVALEGDPVDCPACGTTGKIQCVMPRLPDDLNGKQIALSDDLCICQCSPAPRLIAEQTVKCQFILTADEEPTGAAQARQTTTAAHHFDEQPRLVAPPIEGLPFYIETRDGRTFSGRAGAAGLLPRVATEGEEDYHLYWGDEALARMSGETAHG
jgi:uncharacterized Zn-binding protein involved in type VI secretion